MDENNSGRQQRRSRKAAILNDVVVCAASSALILGLLMGMRAIGLGEVAKDWNDAASDALSFKHLFEWFDCLKDRKGNCTTNPIIGVFSHGSAIYIAIRVLELATGITVGLFLLGGGSIRKGAQTVPTPFVGWFVIGFVISIWSGDLKNWYSISPRRCRGY